MTVVKGEGCRNLYDPCLVDVVMRQVPVQALLDRIAGGRISISPLYRGDTDTWGVRERSAFIESIIVRMPPPVLYFDTRDDGRWLVLDGVKRVESLAGFAVRMDCCLRGLLYIPQYEGLIYTDLPAPMRRRLTECVVPCALVRAGTPDAVVGDIFRRLHTCAAGRVPDAGAPQRS